MIHHSSISISYVNLRFLFYYVYRDNRVKFYEIYLYIFQFLVVPSNVKGGSISLSGWIQLVGFCTFEACVGVFWPSIMKMRSQYIPEEARSTIMNFFRIPLNLFVCIVLYNVSALVSQNIFCKFDKLLSVFDISFISRIHA